MAEELPKEPTPHRRRVRYSGKHPRRFEDKYKELNPEKYPEIIAKVSASGKTPAGSHRPIMVPEILEALRPRPGAVAVDATLGHGGHATALLELLVPGGVLLGLDVDPLELPRTRERLSRFEDAFRPHRSNFAGLPKILAAESLAGADLILADLGISSMQLDNPSRGFSFKAPGPLDLRMNPEKGYPAADLLARISEKDLSDLLVANADEPHARLIAQGLILARQAAPLKTTQQLAGVVRNALSTLPRSVQAAEGDKPIRRVFQALRIAVNDEFGALENFLRILPQCLNPGGRVAILTFHSGEDRRVKASFEEGLRSGAYAEISETPLRPSPEETRSNPRSASAKLRWAARSARS